MRRRVAHRAKIVDRRDNPQTEQVGPYPIRPYACRMMKCIQTSIYFILLLLISCTAKKKFDSPAEKVKAYESRARTYQALADAQRLSPPYSATRLRGNLGIHNPSMRMTYLNEAKRYRALATQAKIETAEEKKPE